MPGTKTGKASEASLLRTTEQKWQTSGHGTRRRVDALYAA
jgi:hypothetical protein